MTCLLLARITRVRRKSVIEDRPEDVLCMHRQMFPDRGRKIGVRRIWHRTFSTLAPAEQKVLIDDGRAALREIKPPTAECDKFQKTELPEGSRHEMRFITSCAVI
jgi:hypothetical protein